MRASAADRDRVVDVLKGAFGEGRLTKDEFDERCTRTMNARTYGDLAQVVEDLPGGAVFGTAPVPYPPYRPAMTTTSGLATGSMVCGILELFTGGLSAIPAVILGHMARSEIRRTGKRGDGMAIAGLVLGYLAIVGWVLIIIAAIALTAGGSTGGTGTGLSGFPALSRYLALPPSSRYLALPPSGCWPVVSAATNASCGTSTRPIVFIRFLPSFCLSRSFRFREMSPP
ncbi:MAG: DUF1707 and DUF4190 domain-containing protein [Nocardiopsaceae bacterium]|nr:DUF1707 and DUF4190 domain-containing protein [Nocardiopsaceae bacterium]